MRKFLCLGLWILSNEGIGEVDLQSKGWGMVKILSASCLGLHDTSLCAKVWQLVKRSFLLILFPVTFPTLTSNGNLILLLLVSLLYAEAASTSKVKQGTGRRFARVLATRNASSPQTHSLVLSTRVLGAEPSVSLLPMCAQQLYNHACLLTSFDFDESPYPQGSKWLPFI